MLQNTDYEAKLAKTFFWWMGGTISHANLLLSEIIYSESAPPTQLLALPLMTDGKALLFHQKIT